MKLAPILFASISLLLATTVASRGAPIQNAAPTFETKVKPFINSYCVDCHDSENHKGGLRLDNLPADFRGEP